MFSFPVDSPGIANQLDVREVSEFNDDFIRTSIVVPLVEAEVLYDMFRPYDNDRVEGLPEAVVVIEVGRHDNNAQWPTVPIDQQTLLRSSFAAVGGILAHRIAAVSGFAKGTIDGLPIPLNAAELVTLFDEHAPEAFDNAVRYPTPEPSIRRAVISKLLRDLVPLATASRDEKDRVENQSKACARSTRDRLWIEFRQDNVETFP
jgi:hypothetical protein